jgi:RNA polymerase sigma factor (sigma-70 family)
VDEHPGINPETGSEGRPFAERTATLGEDDIDRQALICEHLGLVERVANRFRRYAYGLPLEWDDVLQEGMLGLCRAAEKYDPARGSFARLAWLRIRSRVIEALVGGNRKLREQTGINWDRLPTSVDNSLLRPIWPAILFTPRSTCNHHRRPIPTGDLEVCMVCHQSGVDAHPELLTDPRTDPKPERRPPKPKSAVPPLRERVKTRKEKRAEQFRRAS